MRKPSLPQDYCFNAMFLGNGLQIGHAKLLQSLKSLPDLRLYALKLDFQRFCFGRSHVYADGFKSFKVFFVFGSRTHPGH